MDGPSAPLGPLPLLEVQLQEALREVQTLETKLLVANTRVTFFRRSIRQAVLRDLAGEFGAVDTESNGPSEPEQPAVEDKDKDKGKDENGKIQDENGEAGNKDNRSLRSLGPVAPAPKRQRTGTPAKTGPPAKMPVGACVPCWNKARGKTYAGGTHLYVAPCLKEKPLKGRFAKREQVKADDNKGQGKADEDKGLGKADEDKGQEKGDEEEAQETGVDEELPPADAVADAAAPAAGAEGSPGANE
jgi:hypothetical protein